MTESALGHDKRERSRAFLQELSLTNLAPCVSCLIHGSETWPMKMEHEVKIDRTKMRMIR